MDFYDQFYKNLYEKNRLTPLALSPEYEMELPKREQQDLWKTVTGFVGDRATDVMEFGKTLGSIIADIPEAGGSIIRSLGDLPYLFDYSLRLDKANKDFAYGTKATNWMANTPYINTLVKEGGYKGVEDARLEDAFNILTTALTPGKALKFLGPTGEKVISKIGLEGAEKVGGEVAKDTAQKAFVKGVFLEPTAEKTVTNVISNLGGLSVGSGAMGAAGSAVQAFDQQKLPSFDELLQGFKLGALVGPAFGGAGYAISTIGGKTKAPTTEKLPDVEIPPIDIPEFKQYDGKILNDYSIQSIEKLANRELEMGQKSNVVRNAMENLGKAEIDPEVQTAVKNYVKEVFAENAKSNQIFEIDPRNKPIKISELQKAYEEQVKYRISDLYHGGGKDFNQFSTDFIGSGDGNQAYGWGMYFGDQERMARNYAEIGQNGKNPVGSRNVYKVDLPDIDDKSLLLWDKPLSAEQSQKIAEALPEGSKLKQQLIDQEFSGQTVDDVGLITDSNFFSNGDSYIRRGGKWYQFTDGQLKEVSDDAVLKAFNSGVEENKWKGAQLYQMLTQELGGKKEASLFLDSIGIKGNKFKAGGGNNFVIFNDQDVQIKNHIKYRQALEKSLGRELSESEVSKLTELSQKMFGDDGVRVMSKLMTPDGIEVLGKYSNGIVDILDGRGDFKDTYHHEAAHKALDVLLDPTEKQSLIDEVIKKYGEDELTRYAEDQGYSGSIALYAEERLADDFMDYARGREGFQGVLRGVFDKVHNWLQKIIGNKDKLQSFFSELYDGKLKTKDLNNNASLQPAFRQQKVVEQEQQGVSGLEKVGSTTEQPQLSFVDSLKEKYHQAYTAVVDKYDPFIRQSKKLGKGDEIQEALASYYGAASTANAHLDLDLKPILRTVDVDNLRELSIAQRDIELASRGIDKQNKAAAEQIIKDLEKKLGPEEFRKVVDTAQTLREYQINLVKTYLVDTGIISEKAFKAMKEKNNFYTPFKRVQDTVDESLGVKNSGGAGSVGSQNVIRTIKGSNKKIIDPVQSIVENTYKMVTLGTRNQVAEAIARLSEIDPEIVKPLRTAQNVKERMSLFAKAKELKPIQDKVARLLKTRGKWQRTLVTEINKLNDKAYSKFFGKVKTEDSLLPFEKKLRTKLENNIELAQSLESEINLLSKEGLKTSLKREKAEPPKLETRVAMEDFTRFGKAEIPGEGTVEVPIFDPFHIVDEGGKFSNKEFKRFVNTLFTLPDEQIARIQKAISQKDTKLAKVLGQIRETQQQISSGKDFKKAIGELVKLPRKDIEAIKAKIATNENKLTPILDEIAALSDQFNLIKGERLQAIDEAKLLKDAESNGNSTINVMKDGIKEIYEVPKDVAEAARGLNTESVSAIIKILSYPTKVIRATATGLNPEFLLPNIKRDLSTAFVNVGLNPLDFFKGFAHLISKDSIYEDFIRSGGKNSSVSLDAPFLKRTVEELTGEKSIQRGLEVVKPSKILTILQRIAEYSEQPTRIAVFEKYVNKYIKEGLSREQAMKKAVVKSQSGTVNFARTGSKMKTANALVAFLNARVQATDVLLQSIKNNPKGTLARLALITTIPAVLTYLNNRQYQSFYNDDVVTPYDRENNFILMLSDEPIEWLGGAQYLKIPKAEAEKFSNPIESFMAYLDEKGDNKVFKDLTKAFIGLSPVSDLGDVMPGAVKPLYENLTNYSFFRKGEIVPEYKENLPEYAQTTSRTEPIFNLIGKQLNMSPAELENLFSGYFTGYEKLLAPALSEVATNIDPSTAAPALEQGQTINRTPLLRRFLSGERKNEQEQKESDSAKITALDYKIKDLKSGVNRGDLTETQGLKEIAKVEADKDKLALKFAEKYGIAAAPTSSGSTLTESVQRYLASAAGKPVSQTSVKKPRTIRAKKPKKLKGSTLKTKKYKPIKVKPPKPLGTKKKRKA